MVKPNCDTAMRNCPNCGEEIGEEADTCKKCGAQPYQEARNKKNVLLITLISLILPGFGQLYLGKIAKGVMFLALAVGLGWMVHFSLATVVQVFSAYDAYRLVKEYNKQTEQDVNIV